MYIIIGSPGTASAYSLIRTCSSWATYDIIYVNNTLPLATDLYMKLHTELGRLLSAKMSRHLSV